MSHVLSRGSASDFGMDSMFQSTRFAWIAILLYAYSIECRQRQKFTDEDAPPRASVNDIPHQVPMDTNPSHIHPRVRLPLSPYVSAQPLMYTHTHSLLPLSMARRSLADHNNPSLTPHHNRNNNNNNLSTSSSLGTHPTNTASQLNTFVPLGANRPTRTRISRSATALGLGIEILETHCAR